VADAEIIPLGTRGRPGRGTGRDKPSASSRTLAGKRRRTGEPPGADRPGEPPESGSGEGAGERRPGGVEQPQPQPTGRGALSAATGEDRPDAPERVPSATEPASPGTAPAASAPEEGSTRPEGGRPRGLPVTEVVAAARQAAHVVFGEDAEQRLAQMLAFLRRRLTGDYEVDEYGLDPELTQRFLLEMVRPLATKWFRVEVRGVENIPEHGGALVVANHSGTIPVDGLMTMFAVHETTGRNLRPLGADLVFRLPFVGEVARKAGATLACNEDAVRMLSGGELAAVWPEGFKGIGKPYSERYKLQRFGRGGFVSAAIRTGVPIVPVSIVGAEEIYPLVGNVPVLARLLGVPYIPITPFFPLLGPLGLVPLPSKWIIEFGEPIRTDSYDPGAADDPMLVFNVTDQVRETIQQTLYTLLMRRKSVFH
jgi:1-acyl-sn-glycerol-3-phosphate acyltransferase